MVAASNAEQAGWALHRARMVVIADWLAVAVVVTMPWFQSPFQILIGVWLIALVPTLSPQLVLRELRTAAGLLPVLLWVTGLIGMLWADVPWSERAAGLGGFHKLLVIPLLLAQFRRSERGWLVLYGFLGSCTVLLAVSVITWLLPFYMVGRFHGVPVRDYIAQSSEFLICIPVLLAFALERVRARHHLPAAIAAVLAVLLLANILMISTGRTALVVMTLLLLIFGFRQVRWRGTVMASGAIVMIGAVGWSSSPFLRERVDKTVIELQSYRTSNDPASSGFRLDFWRRGLDFVAAAPMLGHGTGSIPEQYRRAAAIEGLPALATTNPHNQVLAVAVQLGMLGAAVLIAMWVAHLALFRGGGLVAWTGVVVVVQNVVSSMFNSHLFDSFHGWLYVFAFGVVGGMMLRGEKDPPIKESP